MNLNRCVFSVVFFALLAACGGEPPAGGGATPASESAEGELKKDLTFQNDRS